MKTVHLVGTLGNGVHPLGRIHYYDGGIDFVGEDRFFNRWSGSMIKKHRTLSSKHEGQFTVHIRWDDRKIVIVFLSEGIVHTEYLLTKESARDYLASIKKP